MRVPALHPRQRRDRRAGGGAIVVLALVLASMTLGASTTAFAEQGPASPVPAEQPRRRHHRHVIVCRTVGVLALVLTAAIVVGYAHAGYRMYVIRTGSMAPTYRPGDLVIDAPPSGTYTVGQVITFRATAGQDTVVTHRIQDIAGGVIHTQGDANRTPDVGTVEPSAVQGKVNRSVPFGGYALIYLRQPTGVLSLLLFIVVLAQAWRLYFPAREP